mmetsp:Transcript_54451/g.59058  ORF Transcript_54451/g.59058 Transcript_54451/m.59058 type:complete len:120 (+) Transcript_54451:500-859(+)
MDGFGNICPKRDGSPHDGWFVGKIQFQPKKNKLHLRRRLFLPQEDDDDEEEGTVGGRRSAENTLSRDPEPNPVRKGGRIALWWLQILKQIQQELNDAEEEEDDEEADGDCDCDGDVEMN